MSTYSKVSEERLKTADRKLQRVFRLALKRGFDHGISEGHRSLKDQERYFNEGKSKVRVGKHNRTPSEAIDARPYIKGVGYPEEAIYFYQFAGVILGIGKELNINIRWGGDWDSDRDLEDQTFMDLMHFELV